MNFVRAVAIIVAVVLVLALLPVIRELTVQDILSYSPNNVFLAFFILLGFYCLKSVVVLLPITILYISAGIMFPIPWAVAITYFCLACEMSIGYVIGRRLGRGGVEMLVKKNAKIGKLLAPSDSIFNTVCFFVRLVPGPLPLDVMSILFGATRVSYSRYIVFSLLGVSPGMIALVVAGNSISNPLSKEFLIPFGIALAVTLAAFIALQVVKKRKDMSADTSEQE